MLCRLQRRPSVDLRGRPSLDRLAQNGDHAGVSSAGAIAESVLERFSLLEEPLATGAVSEAWAPAFVTSGELDGRRVTEHTQMYAASVTKQLVGALAALAVASRELDPDWSIRDVLNELPAWTSPIRIRHLVHHTSGLPTKGRVLRSVDSDREDEPSNRAVIAGLAAVDAPDRPPGVAYEYSNLGYVCLAEAVSRVTGTTLDELARQWIFGPLGLTDSHLGGTPPVIVPGHPAPPRTIGDGGWWTSASDLLRWQRALNDHALGHDVTRLVETPGALDDGTPVSYCWGVAVSWRNGVRTLGHGGSVPGWTSKTVRQPDRGTAVVLLSCCGDIPRVSEAGLRLADALTAAVHPVGARWTRPDGGNRPPD